MGKIFTLFLAYILVQTVARGQNFDEKHNPGVDMNLSPMHNSVIHPDRNSAINPKLNWNINPYKNGLINPDKIPSINPKTNNSLNPMTNQEMNPMFSIYMSPKFENWHGLYVFDTNNALVGYVTKYSQELMMQFDKASNWTFYYVRTAKGTFNQFTLAGQWTGAFLCYDSMTGYNLFDKECTWTGMHIK